MRIAMVSETWAPDINGVAHTLSQLSGELLRRGVSLQLIRPTPIPATTDVRMQHELQVRGFHVPGYSEVQLGVPCSRRILELWHNAPPDVVYIATEGPLGWSALKSARQLRIPVVSGFHTNFDHYAGDYGLAWLKYPVRHVLRYFHNRTQATLAPTQQRVDELSAQGFRNVEVLSRGIDAQHFGPHKRDLQLRRQWGAEQQQPVAIHVGRLAHEKNLDLLVETIQTMQHERPDLISVLVGDGPQRSALEKRLPDTIFTGFIDADALAHHYASADIFLFPSRSETYGNVIAEAMASGLGVVAFRYAAAAELIEVDKQGLSVPFDDDQAFIDAAIRLCRDPELVKRLGNAARVRVEKRSWSSIADDFLDRLNQIVETSRARSSATRV